MAGRVRRERRGTFKSDSIRQYASILNYVDKRDNVRLRELSLAWTVPQNLSGRVGAGATSITLSGQNVWWWDSCNRVDPNMNPRARPRSGSTTDSSCSRLRACSACRFARASRPPATHTYETDHDH
jgi:hypothetical protein